MLIQFFTPYITLCFLASWGLAQNLEGLGMFKYVNTRPVQVDDFIFYPMVLNPTTGVAALAFVLTCILIVVFMLNIRASFYLNKWVGGTSLILWLLPGLLSMTGYLPDIQGMGPDVFRFNEGFPGSMESAAANLLICLVSGWSIIMLLGSLWQKNTFKNVYDHIWYTLGLIAALYFVVDAGLPSYKTDLAEADDRMVRTLQLFSTAEERLEILCAQPKVKALSPALCALAPELKWSIFNHLDLKGNLRARIEPPSWTIKLAQDPMLARQINALNNWACILGQQLAQCQKIPSDTALSIQGIDTPMAFPTPNYAQQINYLFASMEKTDLHIQDIERGHNLRYFVFLFLAFLAGGKLANASRTMVKIDSVRPPSWTLIFIKYASRKTIVWFKSLAIFIADKSRYLAKQAITLFALYQKTRAASREQRKKSEPGQE
ncbi:hypothetical protein [Cedecea colo]|uniref:Uncharacterized protein n=1 Tax=Cedecea colo TaxID=2552946 RepID=A0ABX0VR68_9ENTR|nr:hypothetical protein [Cedecea colo]NIY49246.1 hypothetical protein [Cedecea colo]